MPLSFGREVTKELSSGHPQDSTYAPAWKYPGGKGEKNESTDWCPPQKLRDHAWEKRKREIASGSTEGIFNGKPQGAFIKAESFPRGKGWKVKGKKGGKQSALSWTNSINEGQCRVQLSRRLRERGITS